jgi:hypothetical protein
MRSEEQRRLAREKIAAKIASVHTNKEMPLEVENDEDNVEDLIAEDDGLETELTGDFTGGCIIVFDNDVSDYDVSDGDASEDGESD